MEPAPAQTLFLVRLNPLKNEAHHLLAEHPDVQSIDDYPDYFLSHGLPPKEWINQGLIYIQDPATSHAVDLLAPTPGEKILDAWRAPGGKSSQIAKRTCKMPAPLFARTPTLSASLGCNRICNAKALL